MLPQEPPERPLALCPKEQKCNRGAPSWARSPLRSHPGNPESFPFVCAWGFPGLSLPQASPCGCGSQVCGLGVSTPQGRAGWEGWGESRQHWLPRKIPHTQGHLHPGWVPEQTHVSAVSRILSRQKQPGQAQLSKLQAGLADGQCHFRASLSMWPMRSHPVHLPEGGVGSPHPCQ